MSGRQITVHDIYSFDPNVHVELEEFTDIIGRNVNAGEKMHQRAGVKLHQDGCQRPPPGGLLLGDKKDEKPNCLTRECYRVVGP
jgi:hypothetical protein